jgi:hypothetical protein
MPIRDLQKRARELGRIRLGQKGDKGQPQKLDRFRFTTNSHALITKLAELYGGQPREWEGGTQNFELISDATRLPIMVPPQPVTQWYEFWTRAGCQHRCDGHTNVLTDEPCDPDDPKHQEAVQKPTTRLNVVLRDVEGIGVWRVESHGFNAAIELPDVAEFLAQAGGYEQRTSIEQTAQGPKTRHYAVPIIEVDVTPAQLMAGGGRVAAPQLAGGPVGSTPALAAAGPDYVALAADLEDAEAVRQVWRDANAAGHMTQGLSEHLQQRVRDIEAAQTSGEGGGAPAAGSDPAAVSEPATPPSPEPAEHDDGPEPDGDVVWQQILAEAGRRGTTTPDLEDDVRTFLGGTSSADANGWMLTDYLDDLRGRPIDQEARA